MSRGARLLLLSAFVAIAVSSCGDDGQEDAGILVVAEDTRFRPAELRLNAGEQVRLTLENRDATEHDLQVEGLRVTVLDGTVIDGTVIDGDIAPPGHDSAGHGDTSAAVVVHTGANETRSITFVAEDSGTYEFFCTIPGHSDAGMVGTLTVS
jgi:uncharacterized cupredoxin-like copper-binding protein